MCHRCTSKVGMGLMKETTLCYIENDGMYLMLLRNKKEVDENKGKWIGIGGKIENGESVEECLIRETFEETGLRLNSYTYRGCILFESDEWGNELMHLFTSDNFEGTLVECSEGELSWIPKNDVIDLNLWEGDRVFLKLLKEDAPYFEMKLSYRGDKLVNVEVK